MKNMDDKKISLIVLLDMSKAFDSIRHDLLINRLHKLGVSFAACSWFLSYLSQRMQVVKIEDSLSEPLPLKAGVPQAGLDISARPLAQASVKSVGRVQITDHSPVW